MQHLAPLIYDLALVLAVAGLVTILFHRMGQPIVLGYLIAGIIVGPYSGRFLHVTDTHNLKILAELGVIFLMFSLGLEFSFRKLAKVGFSAAATGTVEVVMMMLTGFAAGYLLGWSFYDSLFLGAAISISSTTIIIKALDELKLKRRHFAELIFGILIVEDLLAILLLAALTTIVVTKGALSGAILWAALKLVVVVGGWFIVGYFLVPSWINRISQVVSEETLTVVSVALCLCLVTLATWFHYSSALGAFIMGSILAETPQIKTIERLIQPMRDIFGAVFFVSVGMLIDPITIIQHWQAVLFLVAVVIIGKVFTSTFGALLTGQRIEDSLRIGFSMAQVGEFSFIIAGLGVALNITSSTLYPVIVAVSAITTFTTPYLIRSSQRINDWTQNKMPPSLRYLFNSYSAWIYGISQDRNKQGNYQLSMFRMAVNSIIIAILFIVMANYVLPFFGSIIGKGWISDSIVWFTTVIVSLPFLWGMVFSFRSRYSGKRLFSVMPFYILPAAFAFGEIVVLSLFLFDSWAIALMLIFSAAGLFLLFYKRLEHSYHWFEKRLLRNLSGTSAEQIKKRFYHLAPWDHHLVKVPVDYNSDAAGKTLTELKLREQYGVNVVAIQRGDQILFAPRGGDVIQPLDLLLVLGSDENIDALRQVAERQGRKTSFNVDQLDQFTTQSFTIYIKSHLVGKTIRDAAIREKSQGMVVGLERRGKRYLNPDPSMVLEVGDVILLVGKHGQLKYGLKE